jgi:uncharacterized protein
MDEMLLRRAIETAIGESKEYRVHFIGGEPLIVRRLLIRAVEMCKTRAIRVGAKVSFSISSNGALISDDDAAFFRENDFEVRVTFDGLEALQNSNRPLRTGSPSYELVSSALENLACNGCNVSIISVVLGRDLSLIPESFDSMRRFNPAKVRFVPLIAGSGDVDSYRFEDLDVYEKSMRALCEEMTSGSNASEIMKLKNVAIYMPNIHKRKPRRTCAARRGSAVAVNTDGKVYPCSTFLGDERYAIGDIDDLTSKTLDEVSCEYNDRCASCWAVSLCGGACMRDNSASAKSCFGVEGKSLQCEFIRRDIEIALGIYCRLYTGRVA